MEVSRGTSARISSDFSIDSILGRADSSERPAPTTGVPDCVESQPSWLFCNRYQPPRIPRVPSGSSTRSRRAGRHARVPFTAAQSAALETAFERAPYLAPPALRALAHALQLREDRIKIWFQNRRARERREKSVFLPPQAVSIPPTHARHHHQNFQTFADFVIQANSVATSDEGGGHVQDDDEHDRGRESPLDVVTVEDCEERMTQR